MRTAARIGAQACSDLKGDSSLRGHSEGTQITSRSLRGAPAPTLSRMPSASTPGPHDTSFEDVIPHMRRRGTWVSAHPYDASAAALAYDSDERGGGPQITQPGIFTATAIASLRNIRMLTAQQLPDSIPRHIPDMCSRVSCKAVLDGSFRAPVASEALANGATAGARRPTHVAYVRR
jgi:hypothetical protein